LKRYLCVLLLLVSSLSFALTPVTIASASINYTTHTLSVVGSGFCTGVPPAVTFNTTRLTVTSGCSSSVIVASLPVQAAGSYRLIIANGGGASATFAVTYGAVGPQGATGPVGPKGATGLTGATGPQGVKGATGLSGATGAQGIAGPQGLKGETGATGAAGATGATGSQGPVGLTGATGAAGPQGLAGTNGTGFNFRNAFDPAATYVVDDVVTYSGSTYLASVANGPNALTPDTNPSAWAAIAAAGAAGADGAIGPQGPIGLPGATGATGAASMVPGPQGPTGVAGIQGISGTNGTGFNFRGVFNTNTTYALNDVVTFTPTSITYNVNMSFGASGSMVGTITTDGAQGVLSVGNIVGWSLTLTDHGTNSTTLTPGNSAFDSGNYNTAGQPNGDFSATPTNLTFTYSNGGFWSVAGTSGQFCITDWSNCFGPVAFGTWSINGDQQYSFSGAGGGSSQVVGTGGTVATSGTSTYVATGSVTAKTAKPGTLPWVMMAQAGTPGTPGAPGINGTNGISGAPGINGINGLPGAQGIQGIPGTNGTNIPANTYVNTTYTHAQVSGSAGIQSPGVIQLTNIPAGSYLVTGNVTLAYGVDPQGHRFVNPWCDLYASDGGGSPMNMGQPGFATMELPFTADGQTTTSTTLVVNGWVTLTNATNLVYVGCSINGPWDTTTLSTLVQTLTAVQSTVVKSAGSAF
jgi:hypothetical protein